MNSEKQTEVRGSKWKREFRVSEERERERVQSEEHGESKCTESWPYKFCRNLSVVEAEIMLVEERTCHVRYGKIFWLRKR